MNSSLETDQSHEKMGQMKEFISEKYSTMNAVVSKHDD